MSNPKPTLGYPSRSAAVLALRQKRKTTREIADAIGIDEKTVTALEHSAARRKRVAGRPEITGRTVLFPVDVLNQLVPHAAKRGISANSLARQIVETVIDDDMIEAVLDDEAS